MIWKKELLNWRKKRMDENIFYDDIKLLGSLHYVVVPKKLIDGAGYVKGDTIKITIKKVYNEKNEESEEE